jgi:2Fe-2S ferredoxin
VALIKFVNHDGVVREADATSGSSLMQVGLDNSIDEIVAECGGAVSCATCHCYVDDAWMPKLPPADPIETAMLDCVLEQKENSRLSCQIIVSDDLDGLTVHLPAAQY